MPSFRTANRSAELARIKKSLASTLRKANDVLTKQRHLKLPYLDLYVRLPLLQVKTDLWHESLERYTYEYIRLYLKVWKWEFNFRLYEPGEKKL